MVTFGSHVGNHQFQPLLSGVYAGVIVSSNYIYIKAVLIYTHVSYKTHKQKKELSLSLSHTNAQNFKAHDDGGPTPDLSTSDRINSKSVPSVSLAIFAVDHV